MDTGIKIAKEGMILREKMHEIISQNLSNINTDYYKSKGIIIKNIDGNFNFDLILNTESGSLIATDNKLNLYLEKNVFLKITDGEKYYFINNGTLNIGENGELKFKDYFILDEDDNKIYISDKDNFYIDDSGCIYQNGEKTNKISLYKIDENANYLEFEKNGLYNLTNIRKIEKNNLIKQGFKEASNVNRVEQIIKMINGLHFYEACQKIILSNDEVINKTIQENIKF